MCFINKVNMNLDLCCSKIDVLYKKIFLGFFNSPNCFYYLSYGNLLSQSLIIQKNYVSNLATDQILLVNINLSQQRFKQTLLCRLWEQPKWLFRIIHSSITFSHHPSRWHCGFRLTHTWTNAGLCVKILVNRYNSAFTVNQHWCPSLKAPTTMCLDLLSPGRYMHTKSDI